MIIDKTGAGHIDTQDRQTVFLFDDELWYGFIVIIFYEK